MDKNIINQIKSNDITYDINDYRIVEIIGNEQEKIDNPATFSIYSAEAVNEKLQNASDTINDRIDTLGIPLKYRGVVDIGRTQLEYSDDTGDDTFNPEEFNILPTKVYLIDVEEPLDPQNGDVVLLGNQEYIFGNGKWDLFGDEGSYALKSIQIKSANNGIQIHNIVKNELVNENNTALLANNIQIAHIQSKESDIEINDNQILTSINIDDFGHVINGEAKNYDIVIPLALAEDEENGPRPGLLSPEDKKKLNNLADDANATYATKDELTEKATELSNKIDETAQDLSETIQQLSDSVDETTQNLSDNIQQLSDRVDETTQNLSDNITSTKQELTQKIDAVDTKVDNLSNNIAETYATKTSIEELGTMAYEDKNNYATKDDLGNVSVDLSDYVTKEELENMDIPIGDLSNYVTKEELRNSQQIYYGTEAPPADSNYLIWINPDEIDQSDTASQLEWGVF